MIVPTAGLVFAEPPGKPWFIGDVVLAVATHAAGWFVQRAALPEGGHYGEVR